MFATAIVGVVVQVVCFTPRKVDCADAGRGQCDPVRLHAWDVRLSEFAMCSWGARVTLTMMELN